MNRFPKYNWQIMKTFTIFFFTLLLLTSFFYTSYAQNQVIASAKTAMKAGKAEDISRYFNDLVEINFEDEKSSYNKQQAEFVLKEFFQKYPALDFQYVHQGSSKEGMRFAIGTYTYNGGRFRVFMLIKETEGQYIIDMLDFGQE